jgi:hypothetical protein
MGIDYRKPVIVAKIKSFIMANGYFYPAIYIGIAQIPEERLFNDHNVQEPDAAYFYENAFTQERAIAIKQHFLGLGCKGNADIGDDSTTFVYAYLITPSTNQDA